MAPRRDLGGARRQLCLLALVGFALGVGASSGAGAQTAEPASIATLYSQAQVDGESSGINISYGLKDFTVPTIAQGAFPISRTELTADPNASGLASIAYPGDLVVGLRAVIAQSDGAPFAEFVPPYPAMAQASYPSDKTEDDVGEGVMRVTTSGVHALSIADYTEPVKVPGLDQVFQAGSMTSMARSGVEEGDVVARSRAVVNDVSLLNGLVTIDSIVTDLVARGNGVTADTDGATTVKGVRFLGLDAVLDSEGLRLKEAPKSGQPTDRLGAVLGGVADGAAPVTAALNELMTTVTGEAGTNLNKLLAAGGMSIRVLEPNEVANGAAASRIANGVLVESEFAGGEQEVLARLVDLVPPDQRGAIGPIPNPVTMLVETHLTTMSIGAGLVGVNAAPPFVIPDFPVDPPLDVPGEGGEPPEAGFESALPDLSDEPSSAGASRGLAGQPISNVLGDALPAVAIILLIIASPLFAPAASRLADNVLSEALSGCPEGLDRPPTEG